VLVVPVLAGDGSVMVEGSPGAVVGSAGAVVVVDTGAADRPPPIHPTARRGTAAMATTVRTPGA
jgi:hypothetical protein